jgi:hypothetical protein
MAWVQFTCVSAFCKRLLPLLSASTHLIFKQRQHMNIPNAQNDWRGNTAQVRRLWDHVHNGGKIRPRDTQYCLDTLQTKEAQLKELRAQDRNEHVGTVFARELHEKVSKGGNATRKDLANCVKTCEFLDNMISTAIGDMD